MFVRKSKYKAALALAEYFHDRYKTIKEDALSDRIHAATEVKHAKFIEGANRYLHKEIEANEDTIESLQDEIYRLTTRLEFARRFLTQ